MGLEIERKFLVTGDGWRTSSCTFYSQGYLNSDIHRIVRVRIAGTSAQLTIKSLQSGATRVEFEYEIPVPDAREILNLCDESVIEKRRHVVPFKGFEWEVDEFLGDNRGLVVAEIELESEDQHFETPEWVGQEVTDDPKYFNSELAKRPFKHWR